MRTPWKTTPRIGSLSPYPRPYLREEGDRDRHFGHGCIVFHMNDDNKLQLNVCHPEVGLLTERLNYPVGDWNDKDIPDNLRTSSWRLETCYRYLSVCPSLTCNVQRENKIIILSTYSDDSHCILSPFRKYTWWIFRKLLCSTNGSEFFTISVLKVQKCLDSPRKLWPARKHTGPLGFWLDDNFAEFYLIGFESQKVHGLWLLILILLEKHMIKIQAEEHDAFHSGEFSKLAIHVRFHRENGGSSRLNQCRWRDPECYIDLIPKI